MKLKLDCVSDLHLYFGPELEGGDILCIAGDISYVGKAIDFAEFNYWLGKHKDKYKAIAFTPGNHDWLAQTNPSLAKGLLMNATHYLLDEPSKILGLNFYGSPRTPEFNQWAFNEPRGEGLKKWWDRIPKNTDVLLTHGVPYGIMDECPDIIDPSKLVHVGDEELLKAIYRLKPKLCIGGHIHEGHGRVDKDGIIFVNASIMDGDYKPVNKPITIYLEK